MRKLPSTLSLLLEHVNEEVDGRVERDEGVREVLDDDQPGRPVRHAEAVRAVPGLVHGGDGAPHVAALKDAFN